MEQDTSRIRSGEELDANSLARYLKARLPDILDSGSLDIDAPIQLDQFPGGHSNLTYQVRSGRSEFVLRRPPFGPVAPTAHDMPREFRLLSAIHPVFPLAPRPYLLCEDLSVIGAPFYLMERRHGLVVRREIPGEVGEDLGLRRRISEAIVDTMATLHAVDIVSNGLTGIGKPVGFMQRQVKGWADRWERAKSTEVPEIDQVVKWLTARLPIDPDPRNP